MIGALILDAIRNFIGNFGIRPSLIGENEADTVFSANGAFYLSADAAGYRPITLTALPGEIFQRLNLDPSRSVPTAHENRPASLSVLFCITY